MPALPANHGPQHISILGTGQMGLVCSAILTHPPHHQGQGARQPSSGAAPQAAGCGEPHEVTTRITLWSHSPDEAGDLAQTRVSERLPHFRLADDARVTADVREAIAGADLIVSAVPVQFIRSAWEKARPHVPPAAAVVSVAKGIENETLLRPTQIIADTLKDDPDARPRPLATLSGPTIAAELARCLPATMIAASDHPSFAEDVQRLFATSWLRIYTHSDTLGVELAGAAKNVIAIAAGVLDGLQAGFNAKSALLARGLAEISRLGAAMGASQETFFGIAGVGDLATTCFSPEGRNRSLGEALGRGTRLEEYLKRSPFIVEGVATCKSIVDLARKYRVDMPITEAVHAVLYEGLDPVDGIGRLMSRELKEERIG